MAVDTPVPVDYASHPDGDIVIRTCDEVDFRVHRLILSQASSVFADMVSMPPETSELTQSEKSIDPPVIHIQEDAKTFNIIIGWIYPTSSSLTPVLDVAALSSLYAAADKYNMARVHACLQVSFNTSPLLESDPVDMWILAVKFARHEERLVASRNLLKQNINLTFHGHNQGLGQVSGLEVVRMIHTHATVDQLVKTLIPIIPPQTITVSCNNPKGQLQHHDGLFWWKGYQSLVLIEVQKSPVVDVYYSSAFALLAGYRTCQYCTVTSKSELSQCLQVVRSAVANGIDELILSQY